MEALNENQRDILNFILQSQNSSSESSNYNLIKNTNGCFVVETDDNFYKIRKMIKNNPNNFFYDTLCKAFAEQYNKIGIEWDYFPIIFDEGEYRVQKREKLKTIEEGEITLDEVLLKYSDTKREVELELDFPYITSIVKGNTYFDETVKMTLARDTEDDLSNYAYAKDSIISLGDSDYFIAFIGENGTWTTHIPWTSVNLRLNHQSFILAPTLNLTVNERPLSYFYDCHSKWWLYSPLEVDFTDKLNYIKKECRSMYAKNLTIASTKTSHEVKTAADIEPFLTIQQ